MKKITTLLVILLGSFLVAGSAMAYVIPYNIGTIETYLSDSDYFNGYEIIEDFDFTGNWRYTAIASEAGNENYTIELPSGLKTFSNSNSANWGSWEDVDFNTQNLHFSDGAPSFSDPITGLDPYAGNVFKLFRLTQDSYQLDYLGSSGLILTAGTYIVGYNDNDSPSDFDADYDDMIVALQPVPEPATMLLLGTGLIGLAAIGRKKFIN